MVSSDLGIKAGIVFSILSFAAGLSVKNNGHFVTQTTMRPAAFDKSDQSLAAVFKTLCGEIGISLDEVVPVDQEV